MAAKPGRAARGHALCSLSHSRPALSGSDAGGIDHVIDNRIREGIEEEIIMLHWAVIFFVIALIAAVFGFGGMAAGAAGIAKILFVAFLLIAVISLVANF